MNTTPDVRGQVFELPAILIQPEGPTEHCRNSLMILATIEADSPAVYVMVPEIGRTQRRIHAAVTMLEHGGPGHLAAQHIRRAIQSLVDAPMDWAVFPALRDACHRLFRALFMLASAGGDV